MSEPKKVATCSSILGSADIHPGSRTASVRTGASPKRSTRECGMRPSPNSSSRWGVLVMGACSASFCLDTDWPSSGRSPPKPMLERYRKRRAERRASGCTCKRRNVSEEHRAAKEVGGCYLRGNQDAIWDVDGAQRRSAGHNQAVRLDRRRTIVPVELTVCIKGSFALSQLISQEC